MVDDRVVDGGRWGMDGGRWRLVVGGWETRNGCLLVGDRLRMANNGWCHLANVLGLAGNV